MRIAFTGSHGVGKSTIVNQLYLDGHARGLILDSFCRPHVRLLQGLSARNKQRLIDYWYVFKHWQTVAYTSSRSIYDTWAYAQLTVGSDFHLNLFHWAMQHIWYDFLFYIPVEFDLIADGIRPEGKEFQLLHDKRLKLILDYHQVPYHTLTGTLEQRVQQMRVILGYD